MGECFSFGKTEQSGLCIDDVDTLWHCVLCDNVYIKLQEKRIFIWEQNLLNPKTIS